MKLKAYSIHMRARVSMELYLSVDMLKKKTFDTRTVPQRDLLSS